MKRVVISGIGCITAIGQNYASFKQSLFAGETGIAPITLFDTTSNKVKIAAEVKNYNPTEAFDETHLKQLDRFTQFALLATREAVKDAGLNFKEPPLSKRTCVIHGTGIGGQTTQEECYEKHYAEGKQRLHPFTVPKLIPSAAASHISMDLGIRGPAFTTSSACSSSGHAIGIALLMLRTGMAEVAVTGGAEACITRGAITAWEGLRVMASDTCRPFSGGRTGMVIGEGAGTLILETLDHAKARGAKIYAEILGVGMSSDANNIIQPLAEGAEEAMRSVLKEAELTTSDIEYINAHGTGTQQNDPTETQAIRNLFAEHADKLVISSTKSIHGHGLGAASVIEAIATIAALQEQKAPPTMNFLKPDPACDLNYLFGKAQSMVINHAISNSLAFGGLNTAVLLKRFEKI